MIKKFILPILIVIILFVGGAGFFWWTQNTKPVSASNQSQSFLITKGSGAIKIANNLEKEKLIKSALAFKIYAKVSGQESKIQAGEYELSPSLSLFQIVNELTKGPKEVWITIPEGLRREEVVEKFIDGFGLKNQVATDFRTQFLNLTVNKEGYLFPDTYLLPKTATADKVVNLLTSTFDKRVATIGELKTQDFNELEILTIASLLERETITEEEKPIVVGIMLNRLNNDWPLQIDAAVQYAIANKNCKTTCSDWWPDITRNDLELTSPYNTYKNQGLPPAPIASPGLGSIEAVMKPQATDYFFYLHSKGKIYYAETLEEHNENIRKYLGK